jgi:hypothetical protein
MTSLLHPSQPAGRATRAQLSQPTQAVLRLKDGRRITADLKTISLTGGLISLPNPVDAGCTARVMFLTEAGMVVGSAEMLPPLSGTLQPFRFVTLNPDDEDRLRSVIQVCIAQNPNDRHGQIEHSRPW